MSKDLGEKGFNVAFAIVLVAILGFVGILGWALVEVVLRYVVHG